MAGLELGCDMYDPNIKDFYERVGRLNKAHAAGYGFEAAGTRGRSSYRRPRRFAGAILMTLLTLLFLAGAAVVLKGAILYGVGAPAYTARVAALPVNATVLAPDPASLWVSRVIHWALTPPK